MAFPGTHLRRNRFLLVIPSVARNLVFAGQRFLVSLGMTKKEWLKCFALSGWPHFLFFAGWGFHPTMKT